MMAAVPGLRWADLPFFQLPPEEMLAQVLLFLAAAGAGAAILVNFLGRRDPAAAEARGHSPVVTATMLLWATGFAALCALGIGRIALPSPWPMVVMIVGLVLIYAALLVNVLARVHLGKNWGDQILVYREHQLVTGGIYRHVRHPLYGTTIAMLAGLALCYANPLVLGLNFAGFVPFMILRVRQEERFLVERFPDYAAYRLRTGMFLPRMLAGKGDSHGES